MAWRKIGQVYQPSGEQSFLASHASVPFAEPIGGGLHRVWFSPRDADGRSYVARLVIDVECPGKILEIENSSTLSPGANGAFDDQGSMMSWLVERDGDRALYYTGWQTRGTVPFHVSIGIAQERQGGSWSKLTGPVMDRSVSDPFFCSNPCVLPDGRGWQMWYLSGLGWEKTKNAWSPSYDIRHARSRDGLEWHDRARPALSLQGDEFALARPSVLQDADGYTMWFCARTRDRPYRLCAATSDDGLIWRRRPEYAQLDPSAEGWDSEMVAYPHVFDHAGGRWMLYCGNGFGRSGFGLAVWE